MMVPLNMSQTYSEQKSQKSKSKEELVTQEEIDNFINEINEAKHKVEFPTNPSLFPVSVRV